MISQENGPDGWEITVTCHYCLECVSSTGPTGNGDPVAALARIDDTAVPFCSPACRSRWLGLHTFEPGTVSVADNVRATAIEALLPDSLNGDLVWND